MKLIRILITILLTISINLSIVNPSKALYTEDLTITGTNGIWTDVRSYNSLSDAIAAIGSKQQTLLIPLEVTCSDLTIPSNITLKFVKTGAINNSGTLTIQTTNIIAGHNQIFTGSGSIDFADNTEVKASWFSSLYNAISQTNNDKVCLTIDNQYTLSTSISLGNNTTLKFLPSTSAISADSGITLSNISKVISSKDTIFTGDGDFDFTQGSIIHTSWFTSFRRAISYINDDSVPVNLLLDSSGLLDADTTVNNYINIKFLKGNPLNIPSGITLTLNGQIDAGDYQIFSGDGSIIFPSNVNLKTVWFSDFETALTKIGSVPATLTLTDSVTLSDNCTISSNISLIIPIGKTISIPATKTLTINGTLSAGNCQVFTGSGDVTGNIKNDYIIVDWFGYDDVAITKALSVSDEDSVIKFNPSTTYTVNNSINVDLNENNTVIAHGARITFTTDTAGIDFNSSVNPEVAHFRWYGGVLVNTASTKTSSTALNFHDFRNVVIEGARFEGFNKAIYLIDRDTFIFKDCHFYNNVYSVYGDNQASSGTWGLIETTFNNCHFSINNQTAGIYLTGYIYNLNIEDCSFNGASTYGIYVDNTGSTNDLRNFKIQGCHFEQGDSSTTYIYFKDIVNSSSVPYMGILISSNSFTYTSPLPIKIERAWGIKIVNNTFAQSGTMIDLDANCMDISIDRTNHFTGSGTISYACDRNEITLERSFVETNAVSVIGYDGDSFSTSNATIDMSAAVPSIFPTIMPPKAWVFMIQARDSASAANNNLRIDLARNSLVTSQKRCMLRIGSFPDDLLIGNIYIVPADSNGDVWINILASGTDTMDIWLAVIGYYQ